MKNHFKQIWIRTFMLMILSTVAIAGERGGNGGVSMVCRDKKGNIISAELLDIYEGREIYGKKYPKVHFNIEQLVVINLRKYPGFLEKVKEEEGNLPRPLFVPKGNELTLTNDALPLVKKKGCEFEQLANYTDDGELLISQEIYDELDLFNRGALFVHEAIYAVRRKYAGDLSSKNSRRLLSHLLAVDGNLDIVKKIVEETLIIPTGIFYSGVDPASRIHISLIPNGFQLEMFNNSGGVHLSSFQLVDYSRRIFKSPDSSGKVLYLVFINETNVYITDSRDRIEAVIMASDKFPQLLWKKD